MEKHELTELEQQAEETGVGFEEEHPQPPAVERIEILPPEPPRPEEGPGGVSHYRSDPELEKEIRELLASSQEVNAENIEVFVQTGNVTLRGTVKTPEERDAAGRIAARGLGVGEIFNELVVKESK